MAETKKKTKSIVDFRNMNEKDLQQKVAELRKQLVEQHRANAAAELPSTSVIGKTRKEIAKLLTVLGENRQTGVKGQEK